MRKTTEGYLYSPSDLITFMESPFATFMDRLRLEFPDRAVPDEEGEQGKLVMAKGLEHEERFLESLEAAGRDVCLIERGSEAFDATTAAISDGREVIFQAALAHDGFAGYADFLVRDPESGLYEVWDTKLSRKPRPYFLVQLCAYADMLEPVLGYRPRRVRVVLGTNEIPPFRTDDYFFYYRRLRAAFLSQMAAFDPEEPPFPSPSASHGRWSSHAEKLLEDADHLCRVANISQSQIRKLEAAGIGTRDALAETTLSHIPRLDDQIFERLKEQAVLQVRSAGLERPEFRVLTPDPEDPQRGLACLPPPSPEDVFFDMEGYPLVEGGLEYLFGAAYREGSEEKFIDWWAHDGVTEQKALESFVDWVVERRRRDPTMHVYHYAPYEVTAVRKLMGRYATREDEVDDLLRQEVFVDLYKVVREGLRIGEPSYSIKNVEHLYRDRREGDVTDAGASIVAYERWIESGEPPDWRSSPVLEGIRDYNIDDCVSTLQLADWLRERQTEAGIAFVPARGAAAEEPKELSEDVLRRKAFTRQLLDEIPASEDARSADPERWKVQELLAHLLEFHRREAKPVWWAMFDRHDMTTEELSEDIHCLGGLVRESGEPVAIKRSKGFRYRFDPGQDTKISEGNAVFLAHDLEVRASVEKLTEDGKLLLKLGPKALGLLPAGRPPKHLSLIPDEFVSAAAIEKAIDAVVTEYAATGNLPASLSSFLFRRAPEIEGHAGGPLLEAREMAAEGTVRIVRSLRGSTLCIQGPPGAGKTYTGSMTIADLLASGKSVGVLSNSHKAIHNLLRAVAEKQGGRLPGIKVGGTDAEELLEDHPDLRCLRSKEAGEVYAGGLIAGTAWFFSRPEMTDRLDYLFVDEAGQVSVANLVAVSRSARNLVLLGDQMQLGQPIQGSHPGESGLSVLDYLLGTQATIPEDLGIFLSMTWRLHPGICEFISGAVYEDRLLPEEHTGDRTVHLPDHAELVTEEAGILFLPVKHEGNTQKSDEEAEVIAAAVGELLAGEWSPEAGSRRPIKLDDILFVAPYNMQVRRLKQVLPEGARVGSVDKFQGREAPIVFVSMCTSPGEAAPRGMEFLLNRNRLNVAISRAKSLAIVVGDPRLAHAPCSSVTDMERLNLYCRLLESGAGNRSRIG
jgi:uncharacterized protein